MAKTVYVFAHPHREQKPLPLTNFTRFTNLRRVAALCAQTGVPDMFVDLLKKIALLKRLEELAEDDDTEVAHIKADNAIIDYLNDAEITKAYNQIHKWYA